MIEKGVMVEFDRGKRAMASSSTSNSRQPPSAASLNYLLYPPPLATYEEVVASPQRFRETLQQLHASMGTKFKIPIVGGRQLDLHRLFVEVTNRGGFLEVLQEKKWKEVTNVFSFPSSATNASFILRKYYTSLLRHYEQVYFFKAKAWSPNTFGGLPTTSKVVNPPHASIEPLMSAPVIQPATHDPQEDTSATLYPGASSSSYAGSAVHGVIDGKFESGYLITVKVGSEECKGILYQAPLDQPHQQQPPEKSLQNQIVSVNESNSSALASRVVRRRRRRKSEIRRRDPDHPKSNRSGYNFFFAEQHARLKPLYPGKDREISRMIGESWNKLNESERAIYQEKAMKDKERYRIEMEGYRERLRMVQTTSGVAPVQQQPHDHFVVQMSDANTSQIVNNEVFVDGIGKNNLDIELIETGTDAFPVQAQPIELDGNMMNLDKPLESDPGNSISSAENETSSNASENSNVCFGTPSTVYNSTQLQENLHPLDLNYKMMDQGMCENKGNGSHQDPSIMAVINHTAPLQQQRVEDDVEMSDKVEIHTAPQVEMNDQVEKDYSKPAEKFGNHNHLVQNAGMKAPEEAERGAENDAERILAGGVEFELQLRTEEAADEAKNRAEEVAGELNEKNSFDDERNSVPVEEQVMAPSQE